MGGLNRGDEGGNNSGTAVRTGAAEFSTNAKELIPWDRITVPDTHTSQRVECSQSPAKPASSVMSQHSSME